MPVKYDSVEELIDSIYFPKYEPDAYTHWIGVKLQAVRHTRAVSPGELLEQQRPNESEHVRQYRLDNYRAITNEGAVKFNDKSARIINNSGYTLAVASEELREWLLNANFSLGNGEMAKFEEYFCRLVMPCSFEDPNALLIAFPFNPENPETPPASLEDGLPANQRVGIKTKIIASEDIKYIDDDYFVWFSGKVVMLEDRNKQTKKAPVYFVADKFNYYRLMPVGIEQKTGHFIYDLELWYNHDTGEGDKHELPVNILGGTLTKDLTDYMTYNESFMKPYFEYGDEVIVTFSDFQAVKVKSAYPIKVMTEQPCQDCTGGKIRVQVDGHPSLVTCTTCNGSGTAKGLSPFKDLIVEKDFDGKESSRPPLEYVSPPVDVLQFLDDTWKSLLEKAKQAINLDLLESVVESGEAKKQRLGDLQDMLGKIAGNLFEVMERYLWHVECLITPNRAQRVVPVITEPLSFDIKSEEQLRNEVLTAHSADVVSSLMEFYRAKYRGNDKLIRIKELALEYAPLLAVQNVQELQTLLAVGGFTEADMIKRQRAEMILKRVSRTIDIMDDANIERIFAEADRLIQPFLPPAPIPIIPDNPT